MSPALFILWLQWLRNLMRRRLITLLLLLMYGLLPLPGRAQEPKEIVVPPYYHSQGPTSHIGPFSEELAAANEQSIDGVIQKMQQAQGPLPAMTMYVLAARLLDLGHCREALYWLFSAEYHTRLLQLVLDKQQPNAEAVDLHKALVVFRQQLERRIQDYQLADLDKTLAVFRKVQADNAAVPDFRRLYPSFAFIPAAEQDALNTKLSAAFAEIGEQTKKNWPTIQEKRKQSGSETKRCE